MASARHSTLLPLLLAAAMAAALTVVCSTSGSTDHARVAAEWAPSDSDVDDSCWGSPEECPVVESATPRGRMGLELYYAVNTAAASPSLEPTTSTAPCISYSALRQDSVPCSVPGASYYNCQPGGDANPYTRGCSAITQCRE